MTGLPATSRPLPRVSLVIPMHNEAHSLDTLLQRCQTAMESLGMDFELVLVDDGSRDNTLSTLTHLLAQRPGMRAQILALSRNFGKEAALTAGLAAAQGEVMVPLDADLQDPPELIGAMVDKWQKGFDVVYAIRKQRQGESWFKQLTAFGFYRTLGRLSSIPIPADTGDFRLMDRQVVDALLQLPEHSRFMKGLFAWVGFRQTAIHYDRDPRQAGQTSWNYWKLWNFALDGITSFSRWPLQCWSYIGGVIALVALVYALYLVVRTLVLGIDVPGYASLMTAVLFLGGIQLIGLGVLGEYLGRVFEEVKQRPLYLIRQHESQNPWAEP